MTCQQACVFTKSGGRGLMRRSLHVVSNRDGEER